MYTRELPRDIIEHNIAEYATLPTLVTMEGEYPYIRNSILSRYRSRKGGMDYITTIENNDDEVMEILLNRDMGLPPRISNNISYIASLISHNGSIDVLKIMLDSPWINSETKSDIVNRIVELDLKSFVMSMIHDSDLFYLSSDFLKLKNIDRLRYRHPDIFDVLISRYERLGISIPK